LNLKKTKALMKEEARIRIRREANEQRLRRIQNNQRPEMSADESKNEVKSKKQLEKDQIQFESKIFLIDKNMKQLFCFYN
jgi:hypothetical protein